MSKRFPVARQFLSYLLIVIVISGMLRLFGMSLLISLIVWLAGSLACIVWAFEQVYKDIERLRAAHDKQAERD
jgi:heme O synthase-like polyprenyltransferase